MSYNHGYQRVKRLAIAWTSNPFSGSAAVPDIGYNRDMAWLADWEATMRTGGDLVPLAETTRATSSWCARLSDGRWRCISHFRWSGTYWWKT